MRRLEMRCADRDGWRVTVVEARGDASASRNALIKTDRRGFQRLIRQELPDVNFYVPDRPQPIAHWTEADSVSRVRTRENSGDKEFHKKNCAKFVRGGDRVGHCRPHVRHRPATCTASDPSHTSREPSRARYALGARLHASARGRGAPSLGQFSRSGVSLQISPARARRHSRPHVLGD